VVGLVAFSAVIFAEPLHSPLLFRAGTLLIGFGGGLFAVATLTAAMTLDTGSGHELNGLALGAWGAVQATATGLAVLAGGTLRDIVSGLATSGALGEVLAGPATGYSFVYHLEMLLLFATLIAVGPLARASAPPAQAAAPGKFGLADLPG
jgi:BCD family chlorophyll transporter-like MFS transporter